MRTRRTPLRLRILMRPRHSKRRGHSLTKPMASLPSEAGDFVHLANTPQTPPPREESRPKVWEGKLLVQYVGLNVAEERPGQTLDGGIDGKTKLKMRLELGQRLKILVFGHAASLSHIAAVPT